MDLNQPNPKPHMSTCCHKTPNLNSNLLIQPNLEMERVCWCLAALREAVFASGERMTWQKKNKITELGLTQCYIG